MFKCFNLLGKNIESVDKRHCNLLTVPDEVLRSFRTIEECQLDANQLKELPRKFFRLTKLKILTVSDNELTKILPAIGNFTQLVELDLSRNCISELPSNIKFLEQLQTCDLSNNPLHRLPEGFSQLSNLRNLTLNDITIAELPADFGNLSSLMKLELRDNSIKSLPASFAMLQKLQFLDLGGNELHALPPFIGELSSLNTFFVDGNELKELPSEIGQLVRLTLLDASENFLESLPEEISGLVSLSDLTLSQNSLDVLPNGIGNLKRLTNFKMDQNQLITLTQHIGSCVALQELILTENFLSNLPASLFCLSGLFHLNVDKNRLSEIPQELGRCKSLNILSLRNNRIHRLPQDIGKLKNLHVLDVSGNKLQRLPVSVSQCQLNALWLSENQSQPIVKLQKDVDDKRGEEYLTCYLLPQEAFDTESMENYLEQSAVGHENPLIQDIASDHDPRRNSRFSGDEDSFRVDSQRASFPKEPKLRHPKFDKKAVDGHIIPKDATHTKDTIFAPGRATPPPNMDEITDDEADENDVGPRARKTSDSVSDSTSFESSDDDDNDDEPDIKAPLQSPEPPPIPVRASFRQPAPPTSNSIAPPSANPRVSVMPTSLSNNDGIDDRVRSKSDTVFNSAGGVNPPTTNSNQKSAPNKHNSGNTRVTSSGGSSTEDSESDSESSEGSPDEMPKPKQQPPVQPKPEVIQKKVSPAVKSAPAIKVNQPNSKKAPRSVAITESAPVVHTREEQPPAANDDYNYSSGGEEIDIISRHVGFTEDVEDNEGKMKENAEDFKLIRRDTPHYTARARIKQKTADGINSEEAVLNILDKYRIAAATQNPEEQHTIEIVRTPGTGLGISIAGGIGSVPFRGDDQSIFISKLNEQGPAALAGLKLGDKVLKVNDSSLVNVKHKSAVDVLRSAGNNIIMMISRQVNPTTASTAPLSPAIARLAERPDVKHERITCTLPHVANNLGFSIAGGLGSLAKQFQNDNWAFLEHMYISQITPAGVAEQSGKLKVGDRLMKINGIDVSEARHDQVVALIMGAGKDIELEVEREDESVFQTAPQDESNDGSPNPRQNNGSPEMNNHRERRNLTGNCTDGDIETIRFHKNAGPLGLAICGGSDHNSHPFGLTEPGVFISRIVPSGVASRTNLRIGDRILKVNGKDISKSSHEEAVLALVEPPKEVILEVKHDPQPNGLKEVYIPKSFGEKVGISIQGGLGSDKANPDDPTDEGIFISQVSPNGAVGRAQVIRVGDRLLEVNNHSLLGASHHEAVRVLREIDDDFSLLICDGIPESRCEAAFSKRNNRSNRLSSSTSVDREDEIAAIAAQGEHIDFENAFEDENPQVNASWSNNPTSLSHEKGDSTKVGRPSPRLPNSPNNNKSNAQFATPEDPIKYSRMPNAAPNNNQSSNKGVRITPPRSTPKVDRESQNLSFKSKRRLFEMEAAAAAGGTPVDNTAPNHNNNRPGPPSRELPVIPPRVMPKPKRPVTQT